MITVTNEVKVYEIGGEEIPIGGQKENIIVSNHWNNSKMVNIFTEGRKITVVANDLITAIQNAVNTNKF